MSFKTLGEVKSKVARAVGKCSTDSYVTDLINEAQQRLLNRAQHVVGGFARYRFCTNAGCIVLPRQIKTVERFAVCETPGEVYPFWHEFLGNGTYLYDNDSSPGRVMVDHGRVATFADIESGQSVTVISVTGGGSGYTSAPTVVITNDSTDTTGAGATATANVAAGAVVSVTVTASGSGFTAAPTITFTGGGGSGATATATIGFNRKVRALSSTAASDTGKVLIIQGYDENNQWVRTLDGASYIDGEKLTLAGSEVNTTTTFTAVTRVIKPVTEGRVDMWSWDSTASLASRQIAAYEPSETLPTYRKMFVPGLQNYDSCGGGSCDNKSVTVLARLQHVPVSADNDFLVVDNDAAIKLMAMAIQREEQNMLQESIVYEQKANAEIEGEFQAQTGEGPVVNIRHAGKLVAGAGVFNPI